MTSPRLLRPRSYSLQFRILYFFLYWQLTRLDFAATTTLPPDLYDGLDPTPAASVLAYTDSCTNAIPESEMIVAIGSDATAINTTVGQDAAEIQTFLETQNSGSGSFLKDFYLDPETKEGFYDQDHNRAWTSGDILYEPITSTDDNEFTMGPHSRILQASQLIARLASCKDALYDPSNPSSCDERTHRVMPRNMLVTLQKEHSLVASGGYPPEADLNDAMGCDENILSKQNFVDQIACAANTFVSRYTEAVSAFVNKSEIFYDKARGARHGYDCPSGGCTDDDIAEGKGPVVTFFVKDRMTDVQYRYTPWIQSMPTGGGVYLFYAVWSGSRFDRNWRGGSE